MKTTQFRYATLTTTIEEDIIMASYQPKLEITIEIAKELVENRLAFSENKPHYILIDFSNVKLVTKEARDYMNDPITGLKGLLGGAFLGNNPVATVFVNLFFRINKPPVPSRFFTDREEALAWLRKIRDEKKVKA
jgi:hypothetical protein